MIVTKAVQICGGVSVGNWRVGVVHKTYAGPGIHVRTEATHVPWTRLEFAKDETAHDRDAVGPVEGDGGDVEDACDGCVATKTDEVDGDAPED